MNLILLGEHKTSQTQNWLCNHFEHAAQVHVLVVVLSLFSFCLFIIDWPQELQATPSHLSHLKLSTLPFSLVSWLWLRAFGSSEHFGIAAERTRLQIAAKLNWDLLYILSMAKVSTRTCKTIVQFITRASHPVVFVGFLLTLLFRGILLASFMFRN